jgi:hypothetical protein
MKLWGRLALIGALLVASVSTAAADTFTLWENFPMSSNGENSFYTAAHYQAPETLLLLDNTSDYSFSNTDGVSVARTGTADVAPLILLTPSSTGDAILYGVPPGVFSLQVTGQFTLPVGGATAHVLAGTVLLTDLSTFTPFLNMDINSGETATFTQTIPSLDSHYALAFGVGRDGGAAYLSATIDATAVPIPGALWLMGSGLVGLIGLRRKYSS